MASAASVPRQAHPGQGDGTGDTGAAHQCAGRHTEAAGTTCEMMEYMPMMRPAQGSGPGLDACDDEADDHATQQAHAAQRRGRCGNGCSMADGCDANSRLAA